MLLSLVSPLLDALWLTTASFALCRALRLT